MKFLKFLLVIFISLTSSVKADLNKNLIDQLQEGGKLIFIRHAYAPGSGDPINFNLNDCSSQRNLDKNGKKHAEMVEVKPKAQMSMEAAGKSMGKKKQVVINYAKWEAATAYAKQRKIRFRVVSEEDLFHNGSRK